MAVVNKMELGRELFRTIAQINQLVEEVKKDPEKTQMDLISLIVGKAQCLHALALINQRD